jgi:O-methyltransferase
MQSTGYDQSRVRYIEGKVEDTVPESSPEQIALLRLDTDWYESTRHELEHLYPLLEVGGVLVIDDYGHWEGCRRAVDEYFENNNVSPFLSRVSPSIRSTTKT